ncbi:nucleotide exchange factor GrpE [Georgenia halophila]|uniref:Protein GrpE n=1 Tax=Georgenia halophila TaxID=620889 RepID=A0ABP8KYR0_9MICO
MSASDNERAEDYEKPVVRDRRKIDPVTGKIRTADEEAPSSNDGGAPAEGSGGPGPDIAEAADGIVPEDASGTVGPPPAGDVGAADPVAEARAEAADLQDQLARRNADVYNLQQEYNAYVRRSKGEAVNQRQVGANEVLEALMGVLDDVELARQHGDLTGPFASIAEKLESTLTQRFQLTRFGDVGEEFDPEVHEALMHTADPEATATTVTQVLQPGYRAGEKVLRAARVAVSSPE